VARGDPPVVCGKFLGCSMVLTMLPGGLSYRCGQYLGGLVLCCRSSAGRISYVLVICGIKFEDVIEDCGRNDVKSWALQLKVVVVGREWDQIDGPTRFLGHFWRKTGRRNEVFNTESDAKVPKEDLKELSSTGGED
jgi:hypothetical protein